jgi:hypothetical protein
VDELRQTETVQVIDLFVDDTPPNTAYDAPPDPMNSDFAVELIPSDQGAGPNTTYYKVVMKGNVTGNEKWIEGTIVSFEAPEDHGRDGTYQVEYYTTDNVGNQELPKKLEVVVDTIAEIEVDTEEGLVWDKKVLNIKGQTEPDSVLTINGNIVIVSDDGSFSHNITLKTGKNAILIEVEDPVGNTAILNREVVFDPPVTDIENFWWLWMIIVIVIIVAVVGVIVVAKRRRTTKAEVPPPAEPEPVPMAQPPPAEPSPYESLPPPPPPSHYTQPQQPPPPQPIAPSPPPPPPPPPPVAAVSSSSVEARVRNKLNEAKAILDAGPQDGVRYTKAKNSIRLAEVFISKGSYDKAMSYVNKALNLLEGK